MQLRKLVIGGLVMGLAMSAGIAYASIPDSNKTVHGCWKALAATNGTHKLTVIDTATTPICPSGFTSLNWPTKGQLLYQNTVGLTGPYTSNAVVATFSGVPAGLMCITGSASAYSPTNASRALGLFFYSSGTAPQAILGVFANEVLSHKTLATTFAECQAVTAGTYAYRGLLLTSDTRTNADDVGSLSVQVFAN